MDFFNTVDFLLYLGLKCCEQFLKACPGGSVRTKMLRVPYSKLAGRDWLVAALMASPIAQSLKSLDITIDFGCKVNDTTNLIYLLKHISTFHAFFMTFNFMKTTSFLSQENVTKNCTFHHSHIMGLIYPSFSFILDRTIILMTSFQLRQHCEVRRVTRACMHFIGDISDKLGNFRKIENE